MARFKLKNWLTPYSLLAIAGMVAAGVLLGSLKTATPRAVGQPPQAPLTASIPPSADPFPMPPELVGVDLLKQTPEQADAKNGTCAQCHQNTHDPHFKNTLHLGCVDCHGGDPTCPTKEKSHVSPRFPEAWPTSANPVRSYTLLNHEDPNFIRFVNPGDLRIAHISCGTTNCHGKEVMQNKKSMMTHGCMLWEAAGYNNGSIPIKNAAFGESYSMHGVPLRIQTNPPPTDFETKRGVVATLSPLPRFEISQVANIFRIFERGGRFKAEIGIPEREEESGRPRARQSVRGLGTQNRTDPGLITLQKTRLLDPTLNFMGTNDHAGDYRSSGCTACHVIYANDRSPVHSGPYAKFGNRGLSFSKDPTIPKNEPGHPIEHKFTTAIPTSQCIVCHIHPGTTVMNSYLGFLWWDEETDGELFYPKQQKYPSDEQLVQSQMSNPDEAAARGNWSDPQFLEDVWGLNSKAEQSQFADFHGHGWVFRAVYKMDRKGNYLDSKNNIIPKVGNEQLQAAMNPETRGQDGVPVHLLDIHLEKGMHCIDCHFVQDVHGNTRLQQEVRAGIEIQCTDCHGTIDKRATLRTSGPASYTSAKDNKGRDLAAMRTPTGQRRFIREGDKIIQRSMVEKDKDGKAKEWVVKQVMDTIDPKSPDYNAKSALAKTVRFGKDGGFEWGDIPDGNPEKCAHKNSNMTCMTCHSSWNPSCFGCHLPQKANKKQPGLHNEGDVSRNYVSYNLQTLRNEVFMIGHDGDFTKHKINPCRSSCAIHVSSYNQNRESIYVQQQTISGEGLSGIAFSSNVPHTVRAMETKNCTDCHVSTRNDNNALMAQLLMHGTNYLNFMGMYCWVGAGEHGVFGVTVTERDEPQAVIGSTMHEIAFPDFFKKHEEHERELKHAHEHKGKDIKDDFFHPFLKPEIHNLQLRGEYLYAACGDGGFRVFDVAFIDDKGFSERITTAPVSPIGQKFHIPTKFATAVGLPCTLTPDPSRTHMAANKEPRIHPLYAYAFVTDKYEGLIAVNVLTAIDGNPLNNFLKREWTFNPDGILNGAENITFVGTYAYICCKAGLVVVDLHDPCKPVVVSLLGEKVLKHPKAVAAQFRYAFVCEEEGIAVLDITDIAHPRPVAGLKLEDAHNIYVARTYAYVAAGKHGLVIVDIEDPERPRIDQTFDAEGHINDCHDVKLGITYTSEFAYLADGKNGMRVVQLTGPHTPGNMGFSPRPTPKLIATYKIPKCGEALCISKALDRDRACDECGNQIGVFGRIGAGPLTYEEQRKMYIRNGTVWRVADDPNDPLYQQGYKGGQRPAKPEQIQQPKDVIREEKK